MCFMAFRGLRAFRGNGKVHLGVVRHVGGICGFGEGNRAQLQSAADAELSGGRRIFRHCGVLEGFAVGNGE